MDLPVENSQTTWTELGDIIKIINLLPSETVVLKLPTKKISPNQLESNAWKEFLFCKAGEYEENSIDIYCYRGENVPNLIIYPEKFEARIVNGIPFFILTSKEVASIGQHVMCSGLYEIVVIDKINKEITGAKVNTHMYQNYVNRYLKGKFFIFPKIVSDEFIDNVMLQYEL